MSSSTPENSQPSKPPRKKRRWWRILLWVLLLPPLLLGLVVLLVYSPPVQNTLRGRLVAYLEDRIGTPVRLDRFSLRYPIGIALDGLLLLDQKGDTLLSARELGSDLNLGGLIDGRIALTGTRLSGVVANIHQGADSTFNFAYILRAFAGDTINNPAAVTDTVAPMPISLSDLALEDILLHLWLEPGGLDLNARVGTLSLGMNDMDAASLLFHATALRIADAQVGLRTTKNAPVPDTYPELANPFAGLDITLEELGLENVGFTMADPVSGDSLWIHIGNAAIDLDTVALERQRIQLASATLDAVRFGTRLPPDTLPKGAASSGTPALLDQHDGFRFWTRGLDVSVGTLSLTNSGLTMQRGVIPSPHKVPDVDHLSFQDIALEAEDLVVNDQHVQGRVRSLSANSGDSLTLRVSLHLDATPSVVQVDDGVLAMNDTEVRFTAWAAPDDLGDLYRYPGQVPVRVALSASLPLHGMPALLQQLGVALPRPLIADEVWDTRVAFVGTVTRADTLRVDLVGDQGTVLHLSGDAQDIRDLPHQPFRADVSRLTMGAGMRSVLTAFVPGTVPIPGRFTGTLRASSGGNAMKAVLDLESDLGDVRGSLSVSGLHARVPDALDADLFIAHVPLYRFTADTAMGPASGHLTAHGTALNTAGRSGNAEFLLSELRYQGQVLDSTRVAGSVLEDSVHLRVTGIAPSLAMDVRADGRWPAGSDTISTELMVRADRVGLSELGWYPFPLSVQGRWRGEGIFSTDGFAHFRVEGDSVMIANPERSFFFKEFALQGHLARDSTSLSLESDALEVEYSTNLPVDSLAPRTRGIILGFFRADSTWHGVPGEHMDLRVALPRTEWLTGLMLPPLKAIELETFEAHYDADADALAANISLPILRYEEFVVSGLAVTAKADGHALDGTLHVDSARYNDIQLDAMSLTAASGPGSLRTALRIARHDGTDRYVVPVEFSRSQGIIGMHVTDGLVLDTVHWAVDPLNQLRFGDGAPVAEHFTLSSGARRAELVTGTAHTTVRLEHFPMGALLNLVAVGDSTPLVAGELSGEVRLPIAASGAMSADLRVDELVLTGQAMGDLSIRAEEKDGQRYAATARFDGGENELEATLGYDGGARPSAVDAHARIGLADLSFLKPFTSNIFYELSGGMSGTVDLQKRGKANSVRGDLTFTDAVFGVKRTGARYRLRNEHVLADAEGLAFHDLTVLDSLGNAFVLDGRVLTTDLSSMRFDLWMHADSFQLVNSAPTKDALFYGDLLAAMDLRITGTEKAPVVKGDLGILAGTSLSVVLPGSEVKLVHSDGIVEFTTDLEGRDTTHAVTDQERIRDSVRARLPQVDLDLRIRVTDGAAFAIVLDPTTGDQASFKGNGDLRFRYDPEGRMNLTGPFVISEGGYTLEFYGLVKKKFDLLSGSTVTWDGDPITARLDIKARYVSESAAFPLVANATGALSETERNRLSARLPFEVVIDITGGMKKPDIGFALDLPRAYRNSYPQVNDQLDRLADKSREEERNRQVFGLLVLNSFIQDEASGGAPSSGLATSAARSSVNGILTDQMNKLTGRYVKGVDIQLGVSTIDQAQGGATYQRTSVDYKVSKSFLDKRLSFEVGGSVGVDENDASTSNVSSTRAAQYAILYDLTRDGRFRLRGFYENAFDLYDGEITDSGIALLHTRDFEENEKARERARERIRLQRTQELRNRRKGTPTDDAPDDQPTPP